MKKINISGFTLIELIVVIVLISIVSVIGSGIISSSYIAYLNSKNVMDADWQGRQALERMARELRIVGSPADITISGSTATSLTFTTSNADTIIYSLSGTSLMRQKNGGTAQILADGIQTLGFTFYDQNSALTAVAANVRYILISLMVTLNNTNFTITTGVFTRDIS